MSAREFTVPLRVYIEDTDAGGIVFYVNYLKYMERARTELMRSLGFDRAWIFNHDLMFVVRHVELSYRAPAVLDDELDVTAAVARVAGASLRFAQQVRRAGQNLVSGHIDVACVRRENVRPRRIPQDMLAKLRAQQPAGKTAE